MGYSNDYMALDESDEKYAIDKLLPDSDVAKQVFNKTIEIYQAYSRFWTPRIEIQKTCNRYLRRDIFTEEQRKVYRDIQEKIPVEPQEMKQVIDPLVGIIHNSVRSASVEMEDGTPSPTAASPEVVAKVLKWWQNQLKIEQRAKKALRDGLVGGYPQWLWFQKIKNVDGMTESVQAVVLDQYSTLCTPYFSEEDGEDIEDLLVISFKKYDELYEIYPERVEAHRKHLQMLNEDPEYQRRLFEMDASITSEDRKSIIYDRVSTARYDALTGTSLIIERYHVLRKKQEVYVNEATKDVQFIPKEWDEWRKEAWLNAHPEYNLKISPEHRTLWVTTIADDGFVWENDEHWFQEDGMLPGAPYIADMVDNLPTGKGEDMLPYILQVAVCETEGLSQVRTGTGTTTFVTEGALRHPKYFEKEMSKENGVVTLKKGYSADQHVKTTQRKPNDTYYVVADRARDQLKNVHAVNDAMTGATNPRQSNKAKQTDIAAGLSSQSPYVINYTRFNLRVAQIMCYMMPYFLTDAMVVEIQDEYGGKDQNPEVVNQTGFDVASGQAMIVANDLTAAKYRIVPVPGDDSVTTREKELKEFVQLLEAVGNTLFQIDPKILANILRSWPNTFAKEAGDSLMKFADVNQQNSQQAAMMEQQAEMAKQQAKADVEMEKIKKPRFNIRLSPQDLKESPQGFQLMMQILNAMNSQPVQPAALQSAMQPEQQPATQGVPSMA